MTNKQITKKFEHLRSEIYRAFIPVEHKKPQLQLKAKPKPTKDIYPTSHVFTMKIISTRRMGKKMFLVAFLNSLSQEKIIKRSDIMIFCPTYNNQPQWTKSSFEQKEFRYRKEEPAANKLLVFDDMQTNLKRNKLIADIFTRGRHKRIGIIQWGQLNQDAAYLEKVNIDYVVSVPSFTEYAAQYYHEKFMSLLPARKIVKLGVDLQQELVKKIIWSLAI